MFLNFYMSNEENLVNVCFRLDDLLNVLTLFGIKEKPNESLIPEPHSLKIVYKGNANKLSFGVMEESNETKARVNTCDGEDIIFFSMVSHMCNKVILNAEAILEFWRCVDLSSDYIQVID